MNISYIIEGRFREPLSGASKDTEVLISNLHHKNEMKVFCTKSPSDSFHLQDKYEFHKSSDNYSTIIIRRNKNKSISDDMGKSREGNVEHSYAMSSIPILAELEGSPVSSVVSLQAYGPVCPRNDFLFAGQKSWHGNNILKYIYCRIKAEVNSKSTFLGSHLCEALIEVGHKVIAKDNRASRKTDNLTYKYAYYFC